MKIIRSLILSTSIFIIACSSTSYGQTANTDSALVAYLVPRFFLNGGIDAEVIKQPSELIYIKAIPDVNGNAFMDYPNNDGTYTNTTLSQDSTRGDVLQFRGLGSSTNCGNGLLMNSGQFTIDFQVYIDNWSDASLFVQEGSSTSKVALSLSTGSNGEKRLTFTVANGSSTFAAVDDQLTVGEWHHIAVTYNGGNAYFNQAKIYIDGVVQSLWYSQANGAMPALTPSGQRDFILGHDFDGKIDEIRVFSAEVDSSSIASLKTTDLYDENEEFKTNTNFPYHWKLHAALPVRATDNLYLEDYVSDKRYISMIKSIMTPDQKLTLMLGGSHAREWATMVQSATARANFVTNIASLVSTYNFDGVSTDFEWPANAGEMNGVNQLIVDLKSGLPNDKIIGYSLHSFFLGASWATIPQATISATDYVSVQSYGGVYTTYESFVSDIQVIRNEGFSDSQIVMGVPLYGVASDGSGATQSYRNIYNANPTIDDSTNSVYMNGYTFLFDGINMIKQKTQKIIDENLGGIMVFALGYDLDYEHPMSLLRAIKKTIDPLPNLALNKPTIQSTTQSSFSSDYCVDGITVANGWPDGNISCTTNEYQAWWEVDLGGIATIDDVKVYKRADCCSEWVTNYHIFVSDIPFTATTVADTQAQSGVGDFHEPGEAGAPTTTAINRTGRYVRVQLEGTSYLNLSEVEVIGVMNIVNTPVTGVSVSPTSLSLNQGLTSDLTETVSPSNATNKTVSWSSSNTSIATVSPSGLVTAVAPGSATITVTTADGGFTANVSITVSVLASNLALNKPTSQSTTQSSFSSDYCVDGITVANGWPDGNISCTTNEYQAWWEVDLGGIATIDDVKVYKRADCCSEWVTNYHIFVSDVPFTAITVAGTQAQSGVGDFHEPGEAGAPTTTAINRTGRYVRVQLEGTSYMNLSEVEVIGVMGIVNTPVTGVSVSPTSLSLDQGLTSDLTETVSPSNATNKTVSWSSSNTFIATVSPSGLVTAVAPGSATITVTTADGGFTANASITVSVQASNLALNKPTSQSTTQSSRFSDYCVDGITVANGWPDGNISCTTNEYQAWWEVDLGGIAAIDDVKVYKRADCCSENVTNYHVFISDVPFTATTVAGTQAQSGVGDFHEPGEAGAPTTTAINRTGRYVRVQLEGTSYLNLSEVEVIGVMGVVNKSATVSNILKDDEKREDMFVYPNPANDRIYIKNLNSGVTVRIFNSTGQFIMDKVYRGYLNISSLHSGIYLLQINDKNNAKNLSLRIIKH